MVHSDMSKLYTGRIADENDSDLRYLEVPLKGKKINHLSKYWSSTQDDPCRSNIGGRDPCNPCGVDAYAHPWAAMALRNHLRQCNSKLLVVVELEQIFHQFC